MAGLLSAVAGGMIGGGKAIQQNAISTIKQRHDEAMQRLTHGQAMERQEHDQQFRRGERIEGQEFTSGENQANRQHDTSLAEMRESGANNRTSMQIGAQNQRASMGLLQEGRDEQGNTIWFNPVTGERYNTPEGVNLAPSGELTDRDQYRLDGIADQIESIRKQASDGMRDLTEDEEAQLKILQGRYEGLLDGGGGTPFEQLMAGEDIAGGGQVEEPPVDPDSVPGMIQQERETQRNTQEANEARREATQARDKADALIDRIEREIRGGASSGGLLENINRAAGRGGVKEETLAEARQMADELLALGQDSRLSVKQKEWIAERLMRLQDAGVPLNLE